MYTIYSWAVDKAESLLSFFSELQVKAARKRLHHLKKYNGRIGYSIEQLTKEQQKVLNEIEELQYFLDQEYKELK